MNFNRRHFFAVAAVIAPLGVCCLWILSYHVGTSQPFSTAHNRYRLVAGDGRVSLLGPPAPVPADQSKQAWDALRELRNDDIDWTTFSPKPGTAAQKLDDLGYPLHPLLRGLDGKIKFGAAHVLLTNRYAGPMEVVRFKEGVEEWNGLEIRYGPAFPSSLPNASKSGVYINPSQIDSMREHWDRIFDVPKISISYIWILLTTCIAPAILLWRRLRALRRMLRQKSGHCVNCGYDVRFSPQRCPECGAPTQHDRFSATKP